MVASATDGARRALLSVADFRRVHATVDTLTGPLDVSEMFEAVLDGALALAATDLGFLSVCDADRESLELKAQRGFDAWLVDELRWIAPGAGPAGTAFRERERVAIEDVEADHVTASERAVARRAGFRASHSTPLISRSGHVVGVLSAHFREPHRASEREQQLIELYLHTAADQVENALLHARLEIELDSRERLRRQAEMAGADAEHANRMRDDFLATVSHELRTPLNAIIGWAHVLRDGRTDAETSAHALATIERNARSQAKLVDDILDVSRIVSGSAHLDVAAVDLSAPITAAVDSMQLAADVKQIELVVALDPSPRRVLGDVSRLQQVVWNLLSNAIKFTPAGGQVDVRLERAGSDAQLTVRDTGQGIALDVLPIVFDRFRQADSSATRRHAGLGLGLAIVRHLVELHGGTVRADSEGPGQGAVFTIRLPLAAEPRLGRSRRSAGGDQLDRDGPLYGAQILIVDDDQDTLDLLSIALTRAGATVESALSAAAAFSRLRQMEPDGLVCDLAMPGEDGCGFIARLRSLEGAGRRHIPAIALTAHTRAEDRRRALSAGFNVFVPKPAEPDEVIRTLARLLDVNARDAE